MIIVGNDISSYQGNVDFDLYSKNSNFVIFKATEGLKFIDPLLKRNQSEARRTNLPLGYYHFARPSYGNDAIAEANYFINAIGELKDGEILCLDFEETYADAVNWCKKFLDRVFEVTGVKCFIYMDQSRVTTYNWKPVVDSSYALWIAAYSYDPNNNNFKTGAWPSAAMQQWTNQQKVPGIQGGVTNVDGDVFFGDQATLKKYGYKKPTPPPVTNWEQKYNDEVAAHKKTQSEYDNYKKQYNQDTQNAAINSSLKALNDRIDKAQQG